MFTYQDALKTEEELKQELLVAESQKQLDQIDKNHWKSTTETKELDLKLREDLVLTEEALDNHINLKEIELRHHLSRREILRRIIKSINN